MPVHSKRQDCVFANYSSGRAKGVEWEKTQLGAWSHGQDPNKNTNDRGG